MFPESPAKERHRDGCDGPSKEGRERNDRHRIDRHLASSPVQHLSSVIETDAKVGDSSSGLTVRKNGPRIALHP